MITSQVVGEFRISKVEEATTQQNVPVCKIRLSNGREEIITMRILNGNAEAAAKAYTDAKDAGQRVQIEADVRPYSFSIGEDQVTWWQVVALHKRVFMQSDNGAEVPF